MSKNAIINMVGNCLICPLRSTEKQEIFQPCCTVSNSIVYNHSQQWTPANSRINLIIPKLKNSSSHLLVLEMTQTSRSQAFIIPARHPVIRSWLPPYNPSRIPERIADRSRERILEKSPEDPRRSPEDPRRSRERIADRIPERSLEEAERESQREA